MKVADFFCGAGGFSEGFRQVGFELVFAVDKWEPAVTTYKGNKPNCNVIQDDVIRISNLPDNEFHSLVPDTEVIIGSPPCVAFSNSNKSGNGDKALGIELLEAYLRIVARKKFKKDSILKYWVLENVPNLKKYIKSIYTADDLGLNGEFSLKTTSVSSVLNAKYYGAPTNRKRYICGDFPMPDHVCTEDNLITLGDVISSLSIEGNHNQLITDINYPSLVLPYGSVTDHDYVCELQSFEWKVAKRLKEDRGYMGKMSFPENLTVPARTVMATMSTSSREAMILEIEPGRYRLPTVREAATIMSFPLDYRFYGKSKGVKHTLVGNAVAPKLSYAIAHSIATESGMKIPMSYKPIEHNCDIEFTNLNGMNFMPKTEKNKRITSKFKYHIPYMILSAFRVELTNYNSNFEDGIFKWDTEIHYSQGKKNAKVFKPDLEIISKYNVVQNDSITFIKELKDQLTMSAKEFQKLHCMTSIDRESKGYVGPYELLELVKSFIFESMSEESINQKILIIEEEIVLPQGIVVGYCILKRLLTEYIYSEGE